MSPEIMAATIGGVVAGSLASVLVRRFSGRRGFYESKVSPLEERVLGRVVPLIEKAAKDHAAMAEQLRQFEARSTTFQEGFRAQLRECVGREELAEILVGTVSREELELALQSAAQQILRVAQANAPANNGNGANIRALQEQVAGISQQLGLG